MSRCCPRQVRSVIYETIIHYPFLFDVPIEFTAQLTCPFNEPTNVIKGIVVLNRRGLTGTATFAQLQGPSSNPLCWNDNFPEITLAFSTGGFVQVPTDQLISGVYVIIEGSTTAAGTGGFLNHLVFAVPSVCEVFTWKGVEVID